MYRKGKRAVTDGIFLKGRSDLDFIVEHSCISNGLDYVRDPDSYVGRLFTIYAESYIPDSETREQGASFLQELFVNTLGFWNKDGQDKKDMKKNTHEKVYGNRSDLQN